MPKTMTEFQDWIRKQKDSGLIVETLKTHSEFTSRRATIEQYATDVNTYCAIKRSHYALAYQAPICPHQLYRTPQKIDHD